MTPLEQLQRAMLHKKLISPMVSDVDFLRMIPVQMIPLDDMPKSSLDMALDIVRSRVPKDVMHKTLMPTIVASKLVTIFAERACDILAINKIRQSENIVRELRKIVREYDFSDVIKYQDMSDAKIEKMAMTWHSQVWMKKGSFNIPLNERYRNSYTINLRKIGMDDETTALFAADILIMRDLCESIIRYRREMSKKLSKLLEGTGIEYDPRSDSQAHQLNNEFSKIISLFGIGELRSITVREHIYQDICKMPNYVSSKTLIY